MSDIFFSYVEEDAALVAQVAAGLEDAGYTTWFFERDSVPGVPYVRQIPVVIDAAQAVVIMISTVALSSPHVDREVVEAYRGGKQFVPLLHGLTHSEFRERRRDWALMLGAAVSVTVPLSGISATVLRIVAGLRQMGVSPSGAILPTQEPPPASPPTPDHVPAPAVTTPPALPVVPNPAVKSAPAGDAADVVTGEFDRERRPAVEPRAPTVPGGYPRRQEVTAAAAVASRTPVTSKQQPVRRGFWGALSRRKFIAALVAIGLFTGLGVWLLAGVGGSNGTPTPTSSALTQSPSGMFSEWEEELTGVGPETVPDRQQLIIKLPSGSHGSDEDSNSGGEYGRQFAAGRFSPSPLEGDFCIEVRYLLKEWPRENGVRVGMATKANGNQGVSVERKSRSAAEKGIDKGKDPNSPDFTDAWVITDKGAKEVAGGEEGWLRLERSGSEMKASAGTNQSAWSESLDDSWTGDMKVYLTVWSHDDIFKNEPVEVVFENFTEDCEPHTPTPTATIPGPVFVPTSPPDQTHTVTEVPPTNTPDQSTVTPTSYGEPVTPRIPTEGAPHVTKEQEVIGT